MSTYSHSPIYGQQPNGQYQHGHYPHGQFPPPPLPPPPPANYAMLPYMALPQKDARNVNAAHQTSRSSPNPNAVAFTANRSHASLQHGNAPYIPPLPHTFFPYTPFQNDSIATPNFSLLPSQDSPQHSSTPIEELATREVLPPNSPQPPDPGVLTAIEMADTSDKERHDTSSVDFSVADREDGELSDGEVLNEPKARSPYRSPSQTDFVRLAAKQAKLSERLADVKGKSYMQHIIYVFAHIF